MMMNRTAQPSEPPGCCVIRMLVLACGAAEAAGWPSIMALCELLTQIFDNPKRRCPGHQARHVRRPILTWDHRDNLTRQFARQHRNSKMASIGHCAAAPAPMTLA